MGACCSCQIVRIQSGQKLNGFPHIEDNKEEQREIEGDEVGDYGALVRLQGSSKFMSMFSQKGRKGVNQDAMTVWENFTGDKDAIFCGVFDGHGPSGHKVARYVRDILPSKLSASLKQLPFNTSNGSNNADILPSKLSASLKQLPFNTSNGSNNADDSSSDNIDDHGDNNNHGPVYSSVKASLIQSFKVMDENLEDEPMIGSYSSGTTAVTVLKKGRHLMIANLGDSRAILCTRGNKDQLVPVQLTVDLKPHLPSECERIRKCKGRVMAMEEEPSVFRVWMPDKDCPGLAMARAFGDFCLKDFGLISEPEVFYRKLTEKDEFVVLATDGIWDMLSNEEVIQIVATARKRSMAARQLVDRAVGAWKHKYPSAKVDDCAVICLFFKHQQPHLTKSVSEVAHLSLNHSELGPQPANLATEDGLETLLNCDVTTDSNDITVHGQSDGRIDPSEDNHRAGLVVNRRRHRPSRDCISAEN